MAEMAEVVVAMAMTMAMIRTIASQRWGVGAVKSTGEHLVATRCPLAGSRPSADRQRAPDPRERR
jgi:hypothetical protein